MKGLSLQLDKEHVDNLQITF